MLTGDLARRRAERGQGSAGDDADGIRAREPAPDPRPPDAGHRLRSRGRPAGLLGHDAEARGVAMMKRLSCWSALTDGRPCRARRRTPCLPIRGFPPSRSSRSIRRRTSSASACSRARSPPARRCRSQSPASAPWPRRRRPTAPTGRKRSRCSSRGLSPAEVVKRITDEDPGRDTRQVAVIDTKGRSAVYTGKRVIDRNHDPKDLVHFGGYAGHVTGRNFSVAGQHAGQRGGRQGDGGGLRDAAPARWPIA